jgi:hypothetical protein
MFPTRPDRLRGPTKLRYNGHRVSFFGVRWLAQPPLSSAEVQQCSYIYTASGISGHFSTTLTEVFRAFSSIARQILAKIRHGRHFPFFLFLLLCMFQSLYSVYCLCKCALYCCHRVSPNVYCTAATGCHQMCTVLLPPGVNPIAVINNNNNNNNTLSGPL